MTEMYAFDDISHNGFPLERVDMVPDFDNMIKGVKYMTTKPLDRLVLSANLQRKTSLNKCHNGFPLGRVDMVPDFDNMIKGVKYMTTKPLDRLVLSANLQRKTSLNKWEKQTAVIIADKQKTKASRRFHRSCVVCPINDGAGEPRVLDLQSQKEIAAMFCVTGMGSESAVDGGHVGMEASKRYENVAVKPQRNAFERMMSSLIKKFSRRISPLA